MRRVRTCLVVLVLAAAATGLRAQAPAKSAPKPPEHAAKPAAHAAPAGNLMNAADMKWGPAPPAFNPGAQMAVVDGDPSKAAPFVIRVKLPDGFKVMPHWHPTDENVTVVSGSLSRGMGEKWDDAAMTTLTAGGFARMPKKMAHYVVAKGETIVQVHGVGPFALTYVNPKDDPRLKKTQ